MSSSWEHHSHAGHPPARRRASSHAAERDDQPSAPTTGGHDEDAASHDGRSEDDQEVEQCPLCMEELDLTDLSFQPCPCNYKICLWCYHQMLEATDAKCPACRQPFVQGAGAQVAPSNVLAAAQHIEAQKQSAQRSALKKKSANAWKERTTTVAPSPSNKDLSQQMVPIEGAGMTPLSEVRVVQRNLCIAAGSTVNLACGLSTNIEMLAAQPSVLAYDAESRGLVARPVAAFLRQGKKACVELRFSDGRTLTCTPDHRLLQPDGQWTAADALKEGVSYVAVGVQHPTIDATEEEEQKSDDEGVWNVHFARLFGYIRSGRRALVDAASRTITLTFTHQQDVLACLQDVAALVGPEWTPTPIVLADDDLHLTLPASLAASLLPLTTSLALPAALTRPSCQRRVVREFLATLFGGAAQSVQLGADGESFTRVSLACSSGETGVEVQLLLARLGLASKLVSNAEGGFLLVESTVTFAQLVGFRYACVKQLQITAACSHYAAVAAALSSSAAKSHPPPTLPHSLAHFDMASFFSATSRVLATTDALPLYRVQLVERRPAGVKEVFDLSVPPAACSSPTVHSSPAPAVDGSFTANGIISHNCYVVGLSSACGREDLLRKREWFGGFGRAMKVAVAKSFGPSGGGGGGFNSSSRSNADPTFACYVTYKENKDAAEAIKAVNFASLGVLLAKGGAGAGGQGEHEPARARASFGTTKYCASWLKGQPCTKNNCLYLHHMAPLADCCTKDQLQRDRFDERFGLGKKSTPSATATQVAAPPPGEMLRSVSLPAGSSTSYASSLPAAHAPAPAAAAAVVASASSVTASHLLAHPKPMSFASVASTASSTSSVSQQAAHSSPPPNIDDFPPLTSNSTGPTIATATTPVPTPPLSAKIAAAVVAATPIEPQEEVTAAAEEEETAEPESSSKGTSPVKAPALVQSIPAPAPLSPIASPQPSLMAIPVDLEALWNRPPIAQLPPVSNAAKPLRAPPGFSQKSVLPPTMGGLGGGLPMRGLPPPGFVAPTGGLPAAGTPSFDESRQPMGFPSQHQQQQPPPQQQQFQSEPWQTPQALWSTLESNDQPLQQQQQQQPPSSHSFGVLNGGYSSGPSSHLGGVSDWSTTDFTSTDLDRRLVGLQLNEGPQARSTGGPPPGVHVAATRGHYDSAHAFQQQAFTALQATHVQQTPPGMIARIPPPQQQAQANPFESNSWMDQAPSGPVGGGFEHGGVGIHHAPSQQQQSHLLGGSSGSLLHQQHSQPHSQLHTPPSLSGSATPNAIDSPMKHGGGGGDGGKRSRWGIQLDEEPDAAAQKHRELMAHFQRTQPPGLPQSQQHLHGHLHTQPQQQHQLQQQPQQQQAPPQQQEDLAWFEQDTDLTPPQFSGSRYGVPQQQQAQVQQQQYSGFQSRPVLPSMQSAYSSHSLGQQDIRAQQEISYGGGGSGMRGGNGPSSSGGVGGPSAGGGGGGGFGHPSQSMSGMAQGGPAPRGLNPPLPHRRPPMAQSLQQQQHQMQQQQQHQHLHHSQHSHSQSFPNGTEMSSDLSAEDALLFHAHTSSHASTTRRLRTMEGEYPGETTIASAAYPHHPHHVPHPAMATSRPPPFDPYHHPHADMAADLDQRDQRHYERMQQMDQLHTHDLAADYTPHHHHHTASHQLTMPPHASPFLPPIEQPRHEDRAADEMGDDDLDLPPHKPLEMNSPIAAPAPAVAEVSAPPPVKEAEVEDAVVALPSAAPSVPPPSVPVDAVPAVVSPPEPVKAVVAPPTPERPVKQPTAASRVVTRTPKGRGGAKLPAPSAKTTPPRADTVVPAVVAHAEPPPPSVVKSTPPMVAAEAAKVARPWAEVSAPAPVVAAPVIVSPRVRKTTAPTVAAPPVAARSSPPPPPAQQQQSSPPPPVAVQPVEKSLAVPKSSPVVVKQPTKASKGKKATAAVPPVISEPPPAVIEIAAAAASAAPSTALPSAPASPPKPKRKGAKMAQLSQTVLPSVESNAEPKVDAVVPVSVEASAPAPAAAILPPVTTAKAAKRGKKGAKRPPVVFNAKNASSSSAAAAGGVSSAPPVSVFTSPSVSPAAVISALATCALPETIEAILPTPMMYPSADDTSLDLRAVHAELVNLGGLVAAGVLPREELASVLQSLADMKDVPTVDELIQEHELQSLRHQLAADTAASKEAAALDDSSSKALPALTRSSRPSSTDILFTYPSLLGLKFDLSLAQHYDSTWRAWERTLSAGPLCREVHDLAAQLDAQKQHEQRARKRMEQARAELEESLMGDLADEEEAFPMAEEEAEAQR